MNRLFEERNKTIVRIFKALYGSMPTMVLYARIGQDFGLSEETVRKIVRRAKPETSPNPSFRGGELRAFELSPSEGGVGEGLAGL